MSSLERGLKAPTITKVEEIAAVIGVHPLSLLALAYLPSTAAERDKLCVKIRSDLESVERMIVRDDDR
jgi:hypothetical protein